MEAGNALKCYDGLSSKGEPDNRRNSDSRNTSLVCFNCLGKANPRFVEVSGSSYLSSLEGIGDRLYENDTDTMGTVDLFGKPWDKGTCFLQNMDCLFQMVCKELLVLDSASTFSMGPRSLSADSGLQDPGRNYFKERVYCVQFFRFLRIYLNRCLEKTDYEWVLVRLAPRLVTWLEVVHKLLGPLTHLPSHTILQPANSAGNSCGSGGHQLAHCHLDLRWLELCLLAALSRVQLPLPVVPALDQATHCLALELFQLSLALYCRVEDIKKETPFGCSCFQEIWIMIHQLMESHCKMTLWQHVEEMLSAVFLEDGKKLSSPLAKSTLEKLSPTQRSVFSLWFMYHIANLCTYRYDEAVSAYPLLETVLKQLLEGELREKDLRLCLYFVEKFCIDLWEPNCEPILLLWEYYQRRLNDSFYIQGSNLDSLRVISKNPKEFSVQTSLRLESADNVNNSFQHFLRIMGLLLKREAGLGLQRQWNRLKGRVYSKLSSAKLSALNHHGEHNLASLLLTLAYAAPNPLQVGEKMWEVCRVWREVRGSPSPELVKGVLACALLTVEHGQSVSNLLTPLAQLLSSLDVTSHYDTFSICVDAAADLLSHDNPKLGQVTFIDSWIARYLEHCNTNDAARLLDAFLSVLIKVNENQAEGWIEGSEVTEAVWAQVHGYLTSSISDTTTPSLITDLTASLAFLFFKLSRGSRFNHFITLFFNNESSDIRLVRRFVCQLLQTIEMRKVVPNFNEVIIKVWVRSCLVSCENDPELQQLTAAVAGLSLTAELCGPGAPDLLHAEEPLLEFAALLRNSYQTKNIFERQSLRERISNYTSGIHNWIKPILNKPSDSDSVQRLFYLLGKFVCHVSPLLYIKSKPTSVIKSIVSNILLPVTVHNPGFQVHHFILNAIRKNLHFFLEGLIKLGPDGDHYVSRCCKEVVVVWVPRCMAAPSSPLTPSTPLPPATFPLIAQFPHLSPALTLLILTTLTSALKRQDKGNQDDASLILKFVKEVLLLHGSHEEVLTLVSNTLMEYIFNMIMIEDRNNEFTYNNCVDIVKLVMNSMNLMDKVRSCDSLIEVMSRVCSENLLWYPRQVFDLICFIAGLRPELIVRFCPVLLDHISRIEKQKGEGYTKLLRIGYDRVQTKIMSVKNEAS